MKAAVVSRFLTILLPMRTRSGGVLGWTVWLAGDGVKGTKCLASCTSYESAVAAARLLVTGDPSCRVYP